MSASTAGIALRSRSRVMRETMELLSSMRFAIALLTVICIASVIGTVVVQNEPANNYVNQFGPFWSQVFAAFDLGRVYSAWWFLLILGFLVVSTTLCILRNTPKIIVDLRSFKENVRERSLAAFHLKGQGRTAESPEAACERVSKLLVSGGWKAKVQQRDNGTMVAARKGRANKIGYIAAHSAIVLICVGGLLDGDLIVRAQMLLQGKTPFMGGGLIREVSPAHRLTANTPTFRANLLVPEGARAGTAIIGMRDGVVLQDLPFDVELKKFIVEYYETGMPKLFASEVVIHDNRTGEAIPATIEVNKPAVHAGVTIYQSSFDDGGSKLELRAIPLTGGSGEPFTIEGKVGESTVLSNAATGGSDALTLEFTGLRVINVENFAEPAAGGTDVRRVDLVSSVQQHMGSGAKGDRNKGLRNVGPSVNYKLRDAAGQAREFHAYMLPIELDGQRVFLTGVRDSAAENYRYLRIPADDQDSMDSWLRLRRALGDAALRAQATARYVAQATPADKPDMAPQLAATAERVLGLFAGVVPVREGEPPVGGLQAVSDFLETSVPAEERPRISEVLLRILNGSLFELLNLTRENAGLAPMLGDAKTADFMTHAVLSLSDSFFYPAPVLLTLTNFEQIQASVFQVARAPGKTLVYLGAVALIIGVFAMLYIRERRLWVWIAHDGEGTKLTTALSTTRRTLDADAEFERLKAAILQPAPGSR